MLVLFLLIATAHGQTACTKADNTDCAGGEFCVNAFCDTSAGATGEPCDDTSVDADGSTVFSNDCVGTNAGGITDTCTNFVCTAVAPAGLTNEDCTTTACVVGGGDVCKLDTKICTTSDNLNGSACDTGTCTATTAGTTVDTCTAATGLCTADPMGATGDDCSSVPCTATDAVCEAAGSICTVTDGSTGAACAVAADCLQSAAGTTMDTCTAGLCVDDNAGATGDACTQASDCVASNAGGVADTCNGTTNVCTAVAPAGLTGEDCTTTACVAGGGDVCKADDKICTTSDGSTGAACGVDADCTVTAGDTCNASGVCIVKADDSAASRALPLALLSILAYLL